MIFADAGCTVGMGHVNRCLPVFNELKDLGSKAELVVPFCPDKLNELGIVGITSVADDLDAIIAFIDAAKVDTVVIDSYRYVPEICEAIFKKRGVKIILFDDRYLPQAKVHVVVNASPAAMESRYAAGVAERFLLGPRYVSINPCYRECRAQFVVRSNVRKILVSLGGSDVKDRTSDLVSALDDSLPADVEILVTETGTQAGRVRYAGWLKEDALANEMCQCDIALLGGGTMLIQTACIGLPAVAWPQHDWQQKHAEVWLKQGTALLVKSPDEVGRTISKCFDVESRRGMSYRGRTLVDGLGSARIAAFIAGEDDQG